MLAQMHLHNLYINPDCICIVINVLSLKMKYWFITYLKKMHWEYQKNLQLNFYFECQQK